MDSTPDSPIQTLNRFLTELDALPPSAPLLAAVSGGSDSVALMHLLIEAGRAVVVAHFDHQTRAGASAEDAAFVRDLAGSLKLHVVCGTAPVEALAREHGLSFEQEARDQRYAFLLHAAQEQECAAIATGHTWDDTVETVLMRLLRGAGAAGLSGIPAVRRESGVLIVRPLLTVRREALRQWLRDRGLPWREDTSNDSLDFTRNRLRHELLPLLRRDYNPAVDDALARLAALLGMDQVVLDACLDDVEPSVRTGATIDRAAFRRLLPALQYRTLLRLAHELDLNVGFEQVARAVDFVLTAPTGNLFEWGGGRTLYGGREQVTVVPETSGCDPVSEVMLPVPGETRFGTYGLRVDECPLPAPPWNLCCTPYRQIFDRDKLPAPLTVRHRRPGDRFQPLGMAGTRKLSDYLLDRGVPAPDRERIPLVLSGGSIIWVVGHAPGQFAALDANTARCIQVEVTDAGE